MKFYHILVIIYIGIILSSLLTLIFGDEGYMTLLYLKKHQEVLVKNIDELKIKNMQLQQELSLLSSDPEKIRILAREQGYYSEGENIIFFQRNDLSSYHYDIGKPVRNIKDGPSKNPALRIIGFAMSVFIIVLSILLRQRKRHDHKI